MKGYREHGLRRTLSGMMAEDLGDRPMDRIEAVLALPFLGKSPDACTVGNNDGREAEGASIICM